MGFVARVLSLVVGDTSLRINSEDHGRPENRAFVNTAMAIARLFR